MAELPLTNVCIVSDRKNCPPRFTILDRTMDNDDADFWKDSFFKNKVTRYLCFTREPSPHNQVITDMALVGVKDQIPSGYTAISNTADTQEQGLRKNNLCIRFVLRNMTSSAIVDVSLFKDNSYKERMYTLVGEVNGINLTFRLAQLTMLATRPAPPVPMQRQIPVGSPPPTANQNAPQAYGNPHHPAPHTYGNVQRMNSTTKPMTGIEGIPFKLNDRLVKPNAKKDSESDRSDMMIRTWTEISELTEYDFSQEKTIVNGAS